MLLVTKVFSFQVLRSHPNGISYLSFPKAFKVNSTFLEPVCEYRLSFLFRRSPVEIWTCPRTTSCLSVNWLSQCRTYSAVRRKAAISSYMKRNRPVTFLLAWRRSQKVQFFVIYLRHQLISSFLVAMITGTAMDFSALMDRFWVVAMNAPRRCLHLALIPSAYQVGISSLLG